MAAGKSDWVKEASLMRKLRHENVCKLFETFEDEEVYYFILELCQGGKLFERLEIDIVLEEAEAARIGQAMTSAVAHLHQKGIIHRDLKPENWLLSDMSPGASVKLVNFGLAETCSPDDDTLCQPCGTLHYVAPEVLRGKYGQSADMWTLGVVIFLMIYAAYPFDGECCTTVMRSILGSEPDWTDSCYALSVEAKTCLKQMLCKDPEKRITAAEAMRHEWFRSACMSSASGGGEVNRSQSLRKRTSQNSQVTSSETGEVPLVLGASLCRRGSALVTEDLLRRFSTDIQDPTVLAHAESLSQMAAALQLPGTAGANDEESTKSLTLEGHPIRHAKPTVVAGRGTSSVSLG